MLIEQWVYAQIFEVVPMMLLLLLADLQSLLKLLLLLS